VCTINIPGISRITLHNGAMMEIKWHEIETAPKDGTEVLLYRDVARIKITGGYFEQEHGLKCWVAGGYTCRQFPPTHWANLPAPPVR